MFWLLLAVALLGLFLTALGLPGLWLFVAAAVGVKLFAAGAALTWTAIAIAAALALLAEIIEFVASVRYTRRYGGSRRAGWGALLGGLIGAVVGSPVPLIGSVIASFLGSFLGALVAEYSAQRTAAHAHRVAWGALVGRVVATGAKIGLGCVLAAVVLYSAWS
jgi:uncharacterized protein YqgC (DUF456 family)